MKNSKFVSVLLTCFFTFTAFVNISSGTAFACDPCIDNNGTPRSAGDTWCSGGALYQCNACVNQPGCTQTVSGEPGNRCYVDPATHPSSEWANCDNTCNVGSPDIYTSIIGTCTCEPVAPAQINLLKPDDVSVTGPDYDVSTAGYQVRIDWQTLADWGENCFGGTTFNHFYELYIHTAPGAENGQRYRIHRYEPVYSDTNPTYGNKVAGSEFILTLTPGQTYYWTVRADNGAVFGPYGVERSFTVNTAPTAAFTTPSGAGQPPYNFISAPTLTPVTVSLTADDSTGNLDQVEVYRRKFIQLSPTNWVWDGAEVLVASDASCTGTTCTVNTSWTPPSGEEGYYWFYIKAFDTSNVPFSEYGKCSGEPDLVRSPVGTISGWAYCGDASRIAFRVAPKVAVQGYMWDSTGQACTDDLGVIQSNALTSADLDDPASLLVSLATVGVSGSRDDVSFNGNPLSNPSFRFEDRSYDPANDAHTLSVNNIFTSSDGFRYLLQCATGPTAASSTASVQSNTSAVFDLINADNNVHLGFSKSSTGWFTITNGDVYSGFSDGTGLSPSIINTLPISADVDSNYDPYMFQNAAGILYTGEAFDVKDVDGNDSLSSSDSYVRRIEPTLSWPESYTYSAPEGTPGFKPCSSAILLNNSVEAGKVYRANWACMSNAINHAGGTYAKYRVKGPDYSVAVIYVDSAFIGFPGPLTFPQKLKSYNHSRILFISEVPVVISRGASSGTPTPDEAPLIEAAIMAKEGITFEGTSDPQNNPDTTVKVEGPLIAGDTFLTPNISINRDRGSTNETPSVIVEYNPIYLTALSQLVKTETTPNSSGLSVINISWEAE